MSNIYASGTPTTNSDFTTILKFANNAMMLNINTVLICTITAITGDNSYTVRQAVNSLNTTGQPTQSPTIYDVKSVLIMGGTAGVIIDYAVGDIVLVGCCQRDSRNAINSQGTANPGTARKFSLSDAVIIGKVPTELPTTYVHISEDEITIESEIVNINADTINLGNSAANKILLENVAMTATIGGVAAGAGVTGVPVTITAGGSSVVSGAL